MWESNDGVVHVQHGGLDEVQRYLDEHDCDSPEDRHHAITHVMSGNSAQIETTMRKIDQASLIASCNYTFMDDPETQGQPVRRYEALVTGSIVGLRLYIRVLKGLVNGG